MNAGRSAILAVAAAGLVVLGGCASYAPGFQVNDVRFDPGAPAPDPVEASVQVQPISWELLGRLAPAVSQARLPRPIGEEPYRIGPGDALRITVWGDPELSGATGNQNVGASGRVVGDDGRLFLPFAGIVRAAGLTPLEFRDRVERDLARVLKEPQVEVQVVAFRSQRVFIAGEVNKPGLLPLDDRPLYVADAVGAAGGYTAGAHLGAATLLRDGKTYTLDLERLYYGGDAAQNVLLRNGDVLTVPDRADRKLFVLGEVGAPRSYILRRGRTTLAEAVADAGGPNPLAANTGQVFVIRAAGDGKPVVYMLDGRSPVSMVLADQFVMQPRDVVYIDPTGLARAGRLIGQLTPFLQALIVTRSAVNAVAD
jgi:polysaccharide biosynthesis/export protein